MTFFPRISGTEALIQVKLLENGQPGREVFLMVGRAGIWTPIGARYALDLPTITKPAILEITLQGRYAQLWHQGQAVIF